MAKLVEWFRKTFYANWRAAEDELIATLEHERIFTIAMIEYMLEGDFTREEILTVIRRGRTPQDQIKIEKEIFALKNGSVHNG